MLQAAETPAVEAQVTQETETRMNDRCNRLFQEWSLELTPAEKEIWLWNSIVEMKRIKYRRSM